MQAHQDFQRTTNDFNETLMSSYINHIKQAVVSQGHMEADIRLTALLI